MILVASLVIVGIFLAGSLGLMLVGIIWWFLKLWPLWLFLFVLALVVH